ncbi:MAG: peptidoglycan-binding domain-containing protein [Paraclostridium sp.]
MNYTRPIYLTSPQMYGDDVREVQKRLNALSYNAGTVDGYFGPSGRSAVLDFQDVNGLEVDGSVGPITWNKLFSSTAKPNSSNSGYTRPIYLTSPQMYGDDVKKVQSRLNSLNYNAGTVDGYFGPSGQAAVKDFQGVNGLAVDGSVGPATWSKLFSSTAKPRPSDPSGIGYYIVDPISTSTPDLFTFSVRTGGDYPSGNYRVYSHGQTEKQGAKIRYKTNWQEGSEYKVYTIIKNINKDYAILIDQYNRANKGQVAEQLASSLLLCLGTTLTPYLFDDVAAALRGINAAAAIMEVIELKLAADATASLATNLAALKYHWNQM